MLGPQVTQCRLAETVVQQVLLFNRVARVITLLGQHIHQAQTQVGALRLLEYGFAQDSGSLAEATIGDIDTDPFQGIRDFAGLAARLNHRLDPWRRNAGHHRRYDTTDQWRVLEQWRRFDRHLGQTAPTAHDQGCRQRQK